jgi:hypothetical protein
MAVKVFCSYSRNDMIWLDRLEVYLRPLIRDSLIEFWHEGKILAGCDRLSQINNNIDESDIIILLISPNYLASDFCYQQMQTILKKRENKKALVVPIILELCDWQNTTINHLQALPRDGKPVNSHSNKDHALYEIANEIQKLIKEIKTTTLISPLKEINLSKIKVLPVTKSSEMPIKILFLAANPKDTPQLRLGEEVKTIEQVIRRSKFGDAFEIKQFWATQTLDLQDCLLRYSPDIVHFSGHGSSKGEIILEDKSGNSSPVSAGALRSLFSILKGSNIKCVVLNACYTESQASAIAEEVDCVIGMSNSIKDDSAINFAAAFYQGLGYGKDINKAFKLGCAQIDLAQLNEQDVPKLVAKNCNPSLIVFVNH